MATKAICSIDGCGKPHKGRGYCEMHLKRLRLHGDPLKLPEKSERKPRKITQDPEKLERNLEMARLYAEQGVRLKELADTYGMCISAARRTLKKTGVTMRDERLGRILPTRRVKVDIDRCVDLYVNHKWPAHRIAEEFGCEASAILSTLRRNGTQIRHHNDTKRGKPAKHRIDIAPDIVARLFASGQSTESAAKALGVCLHVARRARISANIKPQSKVGPKNPNWREDLTAEDRASRRDMYKQANWRSAVYARDNYTCQRCGDADGGNLNAHHIQAHCENVSDRWDVSNGITLCKECHRAFHSRFGLKGFGRPELMDHLASGSFASSD